MTKAKKQIKVLSLTKPISPSGIIPKLQELAKEPTTVGVLEFITGTGATLIDNPANLLLSGGRLTQALFKRKFIKQLYEEIQSYRIIGSINDENLETNQGETIFNELMNAIDEESLDENKFQALKNIFLKTIWKGSDEHTKMLGYQYFQVCKKLSSMDILVLKTAFNIYEQPGSFQRSGGNQEWEVAIAEALAVPRELVTQSRLKNSGSNQTPNTIIFDAENTARHGLTPLGIAIGEYIKNQR